MKPAFKYAIISLLYKAGEEGMWEYDIYPEFCSKNSKKPPLNPHEYWS